MGKGLFITGTDTGVGKTFVGGLLASLLRRRGVNVGVMKPVETGCPRRDGLLLPQDALFLKEKTQSQDPLEEIVPYAFELPAAPAVAAAREGITIDLRRICDTYAALAGRHDLTLVEGAGGLLVPLTGEADNASLILTLGIPALIVTRANLGTINHTLLTIRWALHLGIGVLGVLINHPSGPISDAEQANLEALLVRLPVPLLGIVPHVPRDGEEALPSLEGALDLSRISKLLAS